MMRFRWLGCVMVLGLAGAGANLCAQSVDPLAAAFRDPPNSARPRTWWHWTNGNVSEPGIVKDLAWMKRAGLGGFQLVDVASGGGQEVEPKVHFATDAWYHAVTLSAEEAKRLGLEMSIFSCAGWSEAGGPWVKPEMAMKRLVWSETTVEGGRRVSMPLPMPPSNEGPVRDSAAGAKPGAPHFYRDSVVVAYRTPEGAVNTPKPRITASSGAVDGDKLLDGLLTTTIAIPAPSDGSPAWLQFEYTQPFTARAFSFGAHGRIPVGRLLASDDGEHFRDVVDLPGPQGYHGASIRTFAFPATTARFFRLELTGAGLTPAAVIHGGPVVPAKSYELSEAMLFREAQVNRWEDKGAFGSLMDTYDTVPTPAAPASAEIQGGDVIDLTARLRADGTLDWNVPAGRWTVLRMGYALTGAKNRPSVPAGSGYEVDKLDAAAVRQYFSGYVDPLAAHLGPLLGSTPHYMTMDSWEAGMQNWTPAMLDQFQRRRGYDPGPWLPVLAGHVVGSADQSDRFLWDFRRTLADMYAGEFYATMTDELHKRGMEDYAEASGVALEIPEDTLLNKSHADIPMAEFWVRALHPESMYYVDVRGAASAAHVYGKPIVATESFTGGGYESPYTLKKIADYWFAQGVNRLVFHTSAHQPLDTPPGNTMVGTHLNRNITWAEQARPFMDYIARTSFLLQQGQPVADIAYLLPEGAPSTMPFWGSGLQPAPPPGFDYDYLNTDILLHHAHVKDGRVTLDSGASYRLLVLPPTTQMTPEVAHKLLQLVQDGATITGPRPLSSPSLAHGAEADEAVHRLASDLWGDADGVTNNEHHQGAGTVYSGLTLDDLLGRIHTVPDLTASSTETAPAWVHRHLPDRDLYYVANQSDSPAHITLRLRAKGSAVELWRPMDGSVTPAAFTNGGEIDVMTGNKQPGLQPAAWTAEADLTTVPLDLAPREALFVVLRRDVPEPSKNTVALTRSTGKGKATRTSPGAPQTIATLSGPWTLTFPPHLGAPVSTKLTELTSWTASTDPGVKFFSGTARYTTTFTAPAQKSGERIVLHFDEIRDLAFARLNGKPVGVLWAPPYDLDVTAALKSGSNKLEVDVTNEWTNRILGDQKLPEAERILKGVPARTFFGTAPALPESGLLGEVSLRREPASREVSGEAPSIRR